MGLSLENASMVVNTGEIKRLNRMDFLGKNQYEYAESCMAYLLSCVLWEDYLPQTYLLLCGSGFKYRGFFFHCTKPNSNGL